GYQHAPAHPAALNAASHHRASTRCPPPIPPQILVSRYPQTHGPSAHPPPVHDQTRHVSAVALARFVRHQSARIVVRLSCQLDQCSSWGCSLQWDDYAGKTHPGNAIGEVVIHIYISVSADLVPGVVWASGTRQRMKNMCPRWAQTCGQITNSGSVATR